VILVDTGPLIALADADDAHHQVCVDYFNNAPRPLLIPSSVVPEACYLIGRYLGTTAEARFLRAFPDELTLEQVATGDLRRCADMVDASVIAMAERLGLRTIATLDRRHFTVVRPRHIATFDLVP